MSLPSQEPPDVKNSTVVYKVSARVQVVGGKEHLGVFGTIHELDHIVKVQLDNGVHIHGPFTKFKLIK